MRRIPIFSLLFTLVGIGVSPLFSVGQNGQSVGRIAPHYLSSNTLCYVECADFSKVFAKLNNYLGTANKDYPINGLAGPCNLQVLQQRQRTVAKTFGLDHAHWLVHFLATIEDDLPIIENLLDNAKNAVEAEEGTFDEKFIEQFRAVFPSGGFLAIEDKSPNFRVVFGVEFEPERFNWFNEFLEKASKQNGKVKLDPIETVADTKIYFASRDEVYFFLHDNVLYGVCDDQIDYCRGFASRVVNYDGITDRKEKLSQFKALSSKRAYQRVDRQLAITDGLVCDVFCYADVKKLQARYAKGALTRFNDGRILSKAQKIKRYLVESGESSQVADYFSSPYIGVKLDFSSQSQFFEARVVLPLIVPFSNNIESLAKSFLDIDWNKDLQIVPGLERQVFMNRSKPLAGVSCGEEIFSRSWTEIKPTGKFAPIKFPSPYQLPHTCKIVSSSFRATLATSGGTRENVTGYFLSQPFDEKELVKLFDGPQGIRYLQSASATKMSGPFVKVPKVSELQLKRHRSFKDNGTNGIEFGIGTGNALVSLAKIGEYETYLQCPTNDQMRSELYGILNKRRTLVMKERFGRELDPNSRLLAIAIERNDRLGESITANIFMPLTIFFRDNQFKTNGRGFALTKLVPNRLVVLPLSEAIQDAIVSGQTMYRQHSVIALLLNKESRVLEYQISVGKSL